MSESPYLGGSHQSSPAAQHLDPTFDSELRRILSRLEKANDTPSIWSASDDEAPREGCLRDWLKVLGGFFVTTATFGVINAVGLLLTHLEKNQLRSWSPQNIAWIAATNIFLAYSVPLLAGPIYDRYGPRWLLIVGTACFSAGLVIMSFFETGDNPSRVFAVLMVSWGVLCGAGTGTACTATTGTIYHTFDGRRGIACGLVFTGCSLGGVVWPLMLRETLSCFGWRWALRSLGGAVTALLIVGNLLIRGGYKGTRSGPVVGFLCFRQGSFVLLTASLAVFQFVATSVMATLPGWGLEKGFDQNMMFNIISALNAGAAVGRVTIGALSDKIGRLNAVLLLQSFAVVVIFGLFMTIGDSTAMFYVFAPFWGFSAGAILSMMSVLVGQVCEKRDFGMYYGTNSLIISIAGLVCVPLGKEMVESVGTTAYAAVLGGLCVLGVLLLGVSRWMYMEYRWRWMAKV